jgi:hypothetical protein
VLFEIFSCQPMDWDNASFSVKPLQDAMKAAGLIPDDDWRTLEGRAVATKCATRAEERVEVLLERLEDAPEKS